MIIEVMYKVLGAQWDSGNEDPPSADSDRIVRLIGEQFLCFIIFTKYCPFVVMEQWNSARPTQQTPSRQRADVIENQLN